MKHIVVLGLGKTGVSVVRFLASKPSLIADIRVFDSRENPPGLDDAKAIMPSAEFNTRTWTIEDTLAADLIITSPGIDLREEPLTLARDAGIPVVGDIEIFAQNANFPLVAITGSNGKSTVTRLVEYIGQQSGKNIIAAGNIGLPVLDLLQLERKPDVVVLELSSFQLDLTTKLQLEAAALLNISADHLDRYNGFEDYVAAKQRVFADAGTWILNRQQQDTWPHPITGKVISIGQDEHPNSFGLLGGNVDKSRGPVAITYAGKVVLRAEQLQLQGVHNLLNVQAALGLTLSLGLSIDDVLETVKTFPGLTHRCQLVSHKNGVLWVNDSKATNIGATVAAVDGLRPAITGRLLLIAGGDGKGADFKDLSKALDKVDILLTIGQDGSKIGKLFNGSRQVESLEEAVELAKSLVQSGDMVLLSPACASLDQFNNFEHRGDVFCQSVEAAYGNGA